MVSEFLVINYGSLHMCNYQDTINIFLLLFDNISSAIV